MSLRKTLKYDRHGNVITDDDPILRDGQVLHVPLMLSDSRAVDPAVYAAFYDDLKGKHKLANVEVIAAAKAVRDGAPVIDAAHQRPRSAVLTDEQKRAAAERQAAYDKRLSEAWKQEPPAVVADASKLTATMNILGAMATENAFKAATAAGDPPTLDQARQRYHQRLESAWKHEGDQ
jgi:hypothetical protein